MPTATLTWSAPHGDSNLQSTFAATNLGALQLLNQYFTALAAFSDVPWQICSFNDSSAPYYLTLKRKSGAAGRILFVVPTSSPGTTYNPQFGNNLNWNSSNMRVAFFQNATSDTPANILATSGDVFTNPSGGSGLGPSFAATSGTNLFGAWICEDGIVLRYGTAATSAMLIAVGDLLEDSAGNQAPISIASTAADLSMSASASPTVFTAGGFTLLAGASIQLGIGWAPPAAISTYLRDSGPKSAWFLPRSLCSFQLPLGEIMKYKLRQIAYGPTPLSSYETLTDTGSVLKAISIFPGTTTGQPWLTNFKV